MLHSASLAETHRVLVIKCGYEGLTRRITFPSAKTCRLGALKTRVEECFSLSATPFHLAYTDDDGEDFPIRSEHDLTDAISYFLSSDDGSSSYSTNNASWSSQIPSSSQVRLEVILEYDGPSLSDTSSILSRLENESEDSWAQESLRSITLDGLTEYESSLNRTSVASLRDTRTSEHSTPSATQDDTSSALDLYMTTGHVSPHPTQPLTGPDSESAPSLLTHSELGSRWLRDQSSLAVRRMGSSSRSGSIPRRSRDDGSDEESIGDLELVRDARGKYYYSYQTDTSSVTSGSQGPFGNFTPLRTPLVSAPGQSHESGPSYTGPPILAPKCFACGTRLDYIRYVCDICGESDSWSNAADKSALMTRSDSNSSSSTDRPGDLVSSKSQAKTRSASVSTRASGRSIGTAAPNLSVTPKGFELCPSCVETEGITHTDDAGQNRFGQGDLRHSFREKIWGPEGWVDIGKSSQRITLIYLVYSEETSCTICRNTLVANRFKCVSCNKFALCRSCYMTVDEIHPAHAFLSLPDFHPPDDLPLLQEGIPQSEVPAKPIRHPGAFCHNCLKDIIGPRFHCAVCPSWDLCMHCESVVSGDNGFGHTADHIMMKIPIPLETAEVEAVSQLARERWTSQDSAAVSGPAAIAASSRSSSPTNETVYAPAPSASRSSHGCRCDGCSEWIVGIRYQCANCPSDPVAYNLCSKCERRSYSLHDPFHAFFKLDRPVDLPLRSTQPLLPILYRNAVGRTAARPTSDPTSYLRAVLHRETLCDVHGDQIRGVWLRCAHCPAGFDICQDAEQIANHDRTHVFVMFKAKVDMTVFRALADLDSVQSKPLLSKQVFVN